MTFETWIAFTLAAGILLLIPGPTVLLVVGYALGRGKQTAWATVPGVVLGDFVAMTASLAGLGAILLTSATLFTMLKWLGAAYLIWLGIKLWRSAGRLGDIDAIDDRKDRLKMFGHAFAVTTLNPKSIVFFIAFLPQFIDPTAPVLPQFIVMEITFLTLALANTTAFAMLAGSARETIKQPAVLRTANRIGGSLLIGAGALVATTGRNQ
ncbi:MAG: LysE family translocator [Pseudomonadota bacterium]